MLHVDDNEVIPDNLGKGGGEAEEEDVIEGVARGEVRLEDWRGRG